MTTYESKKVTSLAPGWYRDLSKKERRALDAQNQSEFEALWKDRPAPIEQGTVLIAKRADSCESLVCGTGYRVINHFCTLVMTAYGSNWRQFVTVKSRRRNCCARCTG